MEKGGCMQLRKRCVCAVNQVKGRCSRPFLRPKRATLPACLWGALHVWGSRCGHSTRQASPCTHPLCWVRHPLALANPHSSHPWSWPPLWRARCNCHCEGEGHRQRERKRETNFSPLRHVNRANSQPTCTFSIHLGLRTKQHRVYCIMSHVPTKQSRINSLNITQTMSMWNSYNVFASHGQQTKTWRKQK